MISGRVTDVSGTGVAGATVIVKGTPNGTTTVGDGSFSLDLKMPVRTLCCKSHLSV